MNFELEPSSERFDPVDDRWLDQVAQLVADLRQEADSITRGFQPQTGTKGGLGPIIVSLGSAGAFTAAFEVIKAFVTRDRGRSVRVTWYEDGRAASLEVTGQGLDDDTVRRLQDLIAGRPVRPE